jgi:hypothetical protein
MIINNKLSSQIKYFELTIQTVKNKLRLKSPMKKLTIFINI